VKASSVNILFSFKNQNFLSITISDKIIFFETFFYIPKFHTYFSEQAEVKIVFILRYNEEKSFLLLFLLFTSILLCNVFRERTLFLSKCKKIDLANCFEVKIKIEKLKNRNRF